MSRLLGHTGPSGFRTSGWRQPRRRAQLKIFLRRCGDHSGGRSVKHPSGCNSPLTIRYFCSVVLGAGEHPAHEGLANGPSRDLPGAGSKRSTSWQAAHVAWSQFSVTDSDSSNARFGLAETTAATSTGISPIPLGRKDDLAAEAGDRDRGRRDERARGRCPSRGDRQKRGACAPHMRDRSAADGGVLSWTVVNDR